MASLKELVELNNNGDLSELLAQTFKGEIGRQYPRKDSDVVIGFASQEEVPTIADIRKAIIGHYTGLGYAVELGSLPHSADQFTAFVFPQSRSKEDGSVHIVITTKYPIAAGEGRKNVRITTTVM